MTNQSSFHSYGVYYSKLRIDAENLIGNNSTLIDGTSTVTMRNSPIMVVSSNNTLFGNSSVSIWIDPQIRKALESLLCLECRVWSGLMTCFFISIRKNRVLSIKLIYKNLLDFYCDVISNDDQSNFYVKSWNNIFWLWISRVFAYEIMGSNCIISRNSNFQSVFRQQNI